MNENNPQRCPKCGSEDIRPNYFHIYARHIPILVCVDCWFTCTEHDLPELRYINAEEQPTPTEPEWEDIAIETDGRGLHYPAPRSGMPVCHALAVSEPGFMGYVYANQPGVTTWPVVGHVDGRIEFPIAWRRRK